MTQRTVFVRVPKDEKPEVLLDILLYWADGMDCVEPDEEYQLARVTVEVT